METKFELTKISKTLREVIGEPDEGTRIYRREGSHKEMQEWFDTICEQVGGCVSPGGAGVYAGVTRAGVHRRLKAGNLTAFCFYITGKKKTLFGGEKKLKELSTVYIPSSECKAWYAEMEERARRIEAGKQATENDRKAFEEADPGENDLNQEFLEYDPKDKGKKGVRYLYRPWDKPIPEEGNE